MMRAFMIAAASADQAKAMLVNAVAAVKADKGPSVGEN
jgi:hypothetical protein